MQVKIGLHFEDFLSQFSFDNVCKIYFFLDIRWKF